MVWSKQTDPFDPLDGNSSEQNKTRAGFGEGLSLFFGVVGLGETAELGLMSHIRKAAPYSELSSPGSALTVLPVPVSENVTKWEDEFECMSNSA